MKINFNENKSWDEMSAEEQKEWDNLAEQSPTLQAWIDFLPRFEASKQCFMCSTKFDPIVIRHPGKLVSRLSQFSPDFLFHLKSTHGIDPITFNEMLTIHLNKYAKQ